MTFTRSAKKRQDENDVTEEVESNTEVNIDLTVEGGGGGKKDKKNFDDVIMDNIFDIHTGVHMERIHNYIMIHKNNGETIFGETIEQLRKEGHEKSDIEVKKDMSIEQHKNKEKKVEIDMDEDKDIITKLDMRRETNEEEQVSSPSSPNYSVVTTPPSFRCIFASSADTDNSFF